MLNRTQIIAVMNEIEGAKAHLAYGNEAGQFGAGVKGKLTPDEENEVRNMLKANGFQVVNDYFEFDEEESGMHMFFIERAAA